VIHVDGRDLVVRPFDLQDRTAIMQAILTGGLGLSPMAGHYQIRVPVPPLSDDRRRELAKAASQLAEEARVAMRNVRRDALREAGSLGLPEDDLGRHEQAVEALAKRYLAAVDEALEAKVSDLMGEANEWRPNEPKRKRKQRERLDDREDGVIQGETC